MKRELMIGALLLGLWGVAGAGSAIDGRWVKAGPHAQINAGCTQVWNCQPARDVVYGPDQLLVPPDRRMTAGVCAAGDGPVDGCNECLAAPPDNGRCRLTLQDK